MTDLITLRGIYRDNLEKYDSLQILLTIDRDCKIYISETYIVLLRETINKDA